MLHKNTRKSFTALLAVFIFCLLKCGKSAKQNLKNDKSANQFYSLVFELRYHDCHLPFQMVYVLALSDVLDRSFEY